MGLRVGATSVQYSPKETPTYNLTVGNRAWAFLLQIVGVCEVTVVWGRGGQGAGLQVPPPYRLFIHTWQRLTLVWSCPAFSVSDTGSSLNCCLSSTVVSQKLYLLAK